jgi:thiol-disulfide isomerase/thioredoxin
MVAGKTKKKSKSTSRSVMGRLLPPVDVQTDGQLGELEKRIKEGPLTLVLVYADWCGHCQRFKPMMNDLEQCPDRSIQTARIRDDMFPKTSLSSAKIEGYPTLMLVKKNGEVASFKNNQGEITNAIPEHTDMQKMTTLVRNAGTPEGIKLLNEKTPSNAVLSMETAPSNTIPINTIQEASNKTIQPTTNVPTIPKNILANRIPETKVNQLNTNLVSTQNKSLKEATAPVVGKGQSGGSLWSQLSLASQMVAPAVALFLGAEAIRKRKTHKTRKARKVKKGRK